MNVKKLTSITAFIALMLLAAGIRLLAARDAYPACGDSGHFVQHGVALANGVPGAMSTYWSQGMIAIAAGATKMDLDPRYAMQVTTLVAGVALVLLFAGVIWRLTSSKGLSLVGGLLLATNPTMVQYSITGYSEMPYMALLMAGVCVGLSRRGNPYVRHGLAGVLIGLSGYFKGLDAAVAACGYGLYVFLGNSSAVRWDIRRAAAAPVVAFLVLMPLCLFTFSRTGSFTPGSKGGRSFLALGADWADSKVCYAAEGMRLEERKTSDIIRQIPQRVLTNAWDSVRIFNGQLFMKGMRLGTIWFGLGIIIVVGSLWRWRVREALLPFSLLCIQLGLLWLVFLHDRALAPSLPWVILLILLAAKDSPLFSSSSPHVRRWVVLSVLIYLVATARYALNCFSSEFFWWRYANIEVCAKELKKLGGTDADVVMSYGPALAVEFNKTNPLKAVEVPYGAIEQVSEIADQNHVRFIVVSDAFRSHWPIARLFDEGVPSPANWTLREELVFPEEEWSGSRGHPAERCRIYERLLMTVTKGVER